MTTRAAVSSQQSVASNREAAIRHAVYRDLLDYLPAASYDQCKQFVVNLNLYRDHIGSGTAAFERTVNAGIIRFNGLRVTPELAETACRRLTLAEIERRLAAKYGDKLRHIAGFYRRDAAAPFRLNLPFKCVIYGYGSHIHWYRRPLFEHADLKPVRMPYYAGILCQPIERLNSFFLLSSAKYGGPKAQRLTPRDEQYFTQFEEVNT